MLTAESKLSLMLGYSGAGARARTTVLSHSSTAAHQHVLTRVRELLSGNLLAVLVPPKSGLFCGQQVMKVKLFNRPQPGALRSMALCSVACIIPL